MDQAACSGKRVRKIAELTPSGRTRCASCSVKSQMAPTSRGRGGRGRKEVTLGLGEGPQGCCKQHRSVSPSLDSAGLSSREVSSGVSPASNATMSRPSDPEVQPIAADVRYSVPVAGQGAVSLAGGVSADSQSRAGGVGRALRTHRHSPGVRPRRAPGSATLTQALLLKNTSAL